MRKVLISIAILLFSSIAYAQYQTAGQLLIEQSLTGSLFVMSQSYQLKDTVTGQIFGRNNQKQFGEAYSMALKVDGGYYVTSNLFTPWEGDENYKKYEGKLKPVLYETKARALSDTIWQPVPIDFPIEKDSLNQYLFINDTVLYMGEGLSIDTVKCKTAGWVVLVTKRKNVWLEKITKIENLIYKNVVDFTDTKPSVNVTEMENDFLFGYFIEPKQTEYGQLTFFLKGFLFRDNEGWSVQKMILELNPNHEEEHTNELTPATDDKHVKSKKRKHERKQ